MGAVLARLFLVSAVALPLLTAAPEAGAPVQTPLTRADRWREDLAFLAREFPARQLDFAKLYPGRRFADGIAALERAVPAATDAGIVLGLMRLVAGANVAHTTVLFPRGPLAFHRLPLGLFWFSDGLAVTAASEPYRAAIGLRVVRIGAMTPDALEAAIAPYIAHENEAWLRQQGPSFMVAHELLKTLGQVGPDGRVAFTLARADGTTVEMRVEPGPWQNGPPLLSLTAALNVPATLSRRYPGAYYWYEYLPEPRALYVQYNRCANDPAQPFAEFARGMFADADARAVDRVIVDLRFNGGGDSRVIAPLVDGLRARPAWRARGRLYALIGRGTFSSGLMAAIDFREKLGALLVGEPLGEKPNSYGEVRPLTLPHSQVVVQYSTKFFRLVKTGDPPTYAPDVVALRSLADAIAGQDPALTAALARQ